MRRIGVLVGTLAADDQEWQARNNAFVQGLQEQGWSDGRNLRTEYRWGLGGIDVSGGASSVQSVFSGRVGELVNGIPARVWDFSDPVQPSDWHERSIAA